MLTTVKYGKRTYTTTSRELRKSIKCIEAGLKRLQSKGWCQGSFHNHVSDTYCAVGALQPSGRVYNIAYETIALVLAGIRKVNSRARVTPRGDGIIDRLPNSAFVMRWNDAKGRTKGQVVHAFKHAIKIGKALV